MVQAYVESVGNGWTADQVGLVFFFVLLEVVCGVEGGAFGLICWCAGGE